MVKFAVKFSSWFSLFAIPVSCRLEILSKRQHGVADSLQVSSPSHCMHHMILHLVATLTTFCNFNSCCYDYTIPVASIFKNQLSFCTIINFLYFVAFCKLVVTLLPCREGDIQKGKIILSNVE